MAPQAKRRRLNDSNVTYTPVAPVKQQKFPARRKSIRFPEAEAHRRSERQKTMTQIGFVKCEDTTSDEESEDEIKNEEQEPPPSAQPSRTLKVQKKQKQQTLTQIPEFFVPATDSEDEGFISSDDDCRGSGVLPASDSDSKVPMDAESHRIDTQVKGRSYSPPIKTKIKTEMPITPRKAIPTIIPSSQSPLESPFSSRSSRRSLTRTPLSEKSTNTIRVARIKPDPSREPSSYINIKEEPFGSPSSQIVTPVPARGVVEDSDDDFDIELDLEQDDHIGTNQRATDSQESRAHEEPVRSSLVVSCQITSNHKGASSDFHASELRESRIRSKNFQSSRDSLHDPTESVYATPQECIPEENKRRESVKAYSVSPTICRIAKGQPDRRAEVRHQNNSYHPSRATTIDQSSPRTQSLPASSQVGHLITLPSSPPTSPMPICTRYSSNKEVGMPGRRITLSQLLPDSLLNFSVPTIFSSTQDTDATQ